MKIPLIIVFTLSLASVTGAMTNSSAPGRLPDENDLAFWEKTLQFGVTSQKESVINYIRQKRDKKALELLSRYLPREANPGTRKLMITTLVYFTNRSVVPVLMDILKNEPDQQMKILALASLGELKYRQACPDILKCLDSEDEFLVENAVRALGQMEAVESLDVLMARLETEKSDRIRTALILAIAGMKAEKALDRLVSIATNAEEKEINRGYAVTGLGEIKNRRSYGILERLYPSAAPGLKLRIIDSLGRLEYRDAIGLLREALKDDDRNVRYYSVTALGRLKARECLDILEYKKDYDPDYKVREKVKEVIKELK